MRLRYVTCLLLSLLLAGCFTDAATRLAYDIEAAVPRVGAAEGSQLTLEHRTPSARGECTGPYKVQVDKVGAIIIWCHDGQGATVSSHSTSYHRRFVDTPETWLLDKAASAPLLIELERRNGRVVIASVR